MNQEVSLRRRISDIVDEYAEKAAALPVVMSEFEAAGVALKSAATVGGTWGQGKIDTGYNHESCLQAALLQSAWRHVYDGLSINRLASPRDKRRFDQLFTSPLPFTLENIREVFGDLVGDPRAAVLKALAEVFCDLDPAYKSHDKVKIGVKGLPKRVILHNVSGYGSWGKDRLEAILNAIAVYQGKPLVSWPEIALLLKDGDALAEGGEFPDPHNSRHENKTISVIGRGVRLKRFSNGNGHLSFEAATLADINRALAEFYGDVLADAAEVKPRKPAAGTSVSKDLQYYPTPAAVVERVLEGLHPQVQGQRILEPSCGCGRFLDGLRKRGSHVVGIEVDAGRAEQCKAKGHRVLIANFLETEPTADFDRVVMNPPFYGKHYAQHVEHALKFLKPGGTLTAILPITAQLDHGLLDHHKPKWNDLPVGSFSSSGTNVNTTICTIRKPA